MRERTNTEDLYAVAVIRRSTVVGHVPRNMSAGCALFLRRNHLRMVLFTRAQSCHEKFGHACVHCACALCMRVGGTYVMFIISEDLNLAMFWRFAKPPN